MAEAPNVRSANDRRPDEDSSDERRFSASTAGSRRRSRHYGQQRIGRRSDPSSSTSRATGKSRANNGGGGGGGGYEEPDDHKNLNENAVPSPIQRAENRPNLEDKRGERRDAVRRHAGQDREQMNLSEEAAPPPVSDDEPDDSTPSRPSPSRKPEDAGTKRQSRPRVSKPVTELYTVSYLIFFSILGTLARLGVQWLTFYPGAPIVTPVIWANVGGSLFMGFLSEDQRLFRDHAGGNPSTEKRQSSGDLEQVNKAEHSKRKKTIPLYIGLATGFCGSFTSFSSFMRDVFLALSNNLPTPISHPFSSSGGAVTPSSAATRPDGYSFEAMLAVTFTTIALSIGALIVGAHVAIFLEGYTPSLPKTTINRFMDPAAVFLGWGCWLGAIFLAIWPPDRHGGPSSRGASSNETWRGEVLFALVFAPLGCLLRFYASLKLNGLVAAFPLGTFAVNMLGTAVEGMCYDIQHVGVGIMGMAGGGLIGCQILQGIMDGFCGCLTTVSTWVAEINGLKRKHGYGYTLGSVVGGLCLLIVIMGSVRWSVGWSNPTCNTGYTSKVHG